MTDAQIKMKLFRMLYDAWPDNDLLALDPDEVRIDTLHATLDNCGNPLIQFVFSELCDCWNGEDDLQTLINALDSITDEISGVVEEMKKSIHNWGKELDAKN